MKWYQKELHIKDHPSECILTLMGVYNHPDSNIPTTIQIILNINNMTTGDNKNIVLYSKNPSVLIAPDDFVDPDMILAKYHRNIQKCITKVEKQTLNDILSWT